MNRTAAPPAPPAQPVARPDAPGPSLVTAAGFERWYAATYDRAVRAVLARTGDRDQAQDCVQEAYLRAWQRRHDLADLDRRDAWVLITAHRLAISGWRSAQVRRRSLDRALAPPLVSAAPSVDRVALTAALRSIRPQHRHALVLFYLADLSVDEIASRLAVPPGTVKSWLSRGRSALVESLVADVDA